MGRNLNLNNQKYSMMKSNKLMYVYNDASAIHLLTRRRKAGPTKERLFTPDHLRFDLRTFDDYSSYNKGRTVLYGSTLFGCKPRDVDKKCIAHVDTLRNYRSDQPTSSIRWEDEYCVTRNYI